MAQSYMLYPFGADVLEEEELPDGAKILINDNGEMKQVPVSVFGSSKSNKPNASNNNTLE